MRPFTRDARQTAPPALRVRTLPLGWSTYRLRDLHIDADGQAWIGANEPDRHLPVVDLATGKARKVDFSLGEGQYLDMVLPVGDWLVVCGGAYARQVFVHRRSLRRVEKPLRPDPLIYGGVVVSDAAYLFDSHYGIWRWEPRRAQGQLFPFDGEGKPPVGGSHFPAGECLYTIPWWQEGMPPTAMFRFDLTTHRFGPPLRPPWPDIRPMAPVALGGLLYQSDMLGGTLLAFDPNTERWIGRWRLPGYETSWKYAASVTTFDRFVVCCLSTFQGTKNASGTYGFDGKRHHFVHQILLFDPERQSAALVPVPSLSGTGYATIAYLRGVGTRLWGTCVDSALPDGKPEEKGPAYLVEFS